MVCAVQPTTPAEFPGTARVGTEAVVADLYRVLGLEDLHGHVLKAAVDVVDQPILSITGGKCAPTTRIRLDREEGYVAFARVQTGQVDDHRIAVVRARGLLGERWRESFDNQIDQQAQWGEIPLARRRFLGVEHRPHRGSDRQRGKCAAVYRPVGVDK